LRRGLIGGLIIALLELGVLPGPLQAQTEAPPDRVIVYGDVAKRWQTDATSFVDLRGTVVISRGDSRLTAERAILWINQPASDRTGQVVMDCYAAGRVVTTENGALVESPEAFFSWKVASLTVDDEDGKIEGVVPPGMDACLARACAVQSYGGLEGFPTFIGPKHTSGLPARSRSYATAPELQPMRFGTIYSQKTPMAEITVRREGDYLITMATRCPDIIFEDPDIEMGQLEILADNVVVWVNEKKMNETGDLRQSELQFYAEGHVVVHYRERVLRCERLFFDYSNQRALIVGGTEGYAVIQGYYGETQIPYYYHAKVIRQLDRDHYTADNVKITTSSFGRPEWYVRVHRMDLAIARQKASEDAADRGDIVSEKAIFHHSLFTVGGWPIAYLPYWSHDLVRDRALLKHLSFGSSSDFGTEIRTGWDLYALGLYENDWSNLTLLMDYLSKRGLGHGVEFDYARPDDAGWLHAWRINDKHEDLDPVPEDPESRGRVRWFHRHIFDPSWRLDFEVSYLSDPDFLREFFEQEYKEGKPQETLAYLHYTKANRAFTLLSKFNINDFTTETEYLPEARAQIIGQPFLDNRLVYTTDNRLGFLRRHQDDRIAGPPGDYDAMRMDTYHELQLPLSVSMLKVTPFTSARYTWYDDDPLGDANDRALLAAGVSVSSRLWRVYDVHSRLGDLNGLRHIVVPTVTYANTFESSTPAGELYQFDGVDALDKMQVVNLRLHQRLQTKRASRQRVPSAQSDWRVVDWMKLDADINYYPDADRDNGGREFSNLLLDYEFRVTDRLAVVADAEIDVDDQQRFETAAVGINLQRTPRLHIYLGQRYLREDKSSVSIGRLEYMIDERWRIGLLGKYDWDTGTSDDVRVTLSRILHDWELRVGYEHEEGDDDKVFTIEFIPVWVPQVQFRLY